MVIASGKSFGLMNLKYSMADLLNISRIALALVIPVKQSNVKITSNGIGYHHTMLKV